MCCTARPHASAAVQTTPRLPTEAFARLPQLSQVALSPDGTWFAAIMNRGSDTVAVVRPLDATSPTPLAAQFQAPVLLVHGTNDRSVPCAQSETMFKALQAAGKNVRLVTLDKGNHFLGDQAHRLQFYSELKDILARHIGTAEPAK